MKAQAKKLQFGSSLSSDMIENMEHIATTNAKSVAPTTGQSGLRRASRKSSPRDWQPT
jgi:hypothetical protein